VVTHDVSPYTIVGGVPAREIKQRFPQPVIDRLLQLQWWNWPAEQIRHALPALTHGEIEKLTVA
jgi:virginiamycin A acetyltransferase